MNSREKYRIYCEEEKELPLFLSYDWLETVSKGNWDVVLQEKDDKVTGALPFVFNPKGGIKRIVLPALTPYGGIWINYPAGQKYASELSYEKETYTYLINKLPAYDSFEVKFYPGFKNWLPLYWKGYKQTTMYTYILNNLSDTDKIFGAFRENLRREIRKAEKRIIVKSVENIEVLYKLKDKSVMAGKGKANASKEYLESIFGLCKRKNCGEVLIAVEGDDIHSAALFVWDKNTCYYLYGASDPDYKNSGAMSLLLWEAIKRSSGKS